MTSNDFLAISELLDTKLEPIREVQVKMQGELAELRVELKGDINELRTELNDVKGELGQVKTSQIRTELLLENDVLPRLQNIEACYTDTYDKYAGGIAEIKAVKADVDVMKDVIKEHSKILQAL